MFVETLDVVNACLGTLGEAPLNTLETDHSFKAAALDKLNTANLDVQKKGWWFNTENIELKPDAVTKFIAVPQDVIKLSADVEGLTYTTRGKRLFDVQNGTYEFTKSVCIQVVRVLPFADLPYHASSAIRDEAVLKFQQVYDGDATRYRELQGAAIVTRGELNAEEVRQRKANPLRGALLRAFAPMQFGKPDIPFPR